MKEKNKRNGQKKEEDETQRKQIKENKEKEKGKRRASPQGMWQTLEKNEPKTQTAPLHTEYSSTRSNTENQ